MSKDYRVELKQSLYIIKWNGGGQLPKELTGEFTTPKEAMYAVEAYEQSNAARRKTTRKVANGKSTS